MFSSTAFAVPSSLVLISNRVRASDSWLVRFWYRSYSCTFSLIFNQLIVSLFLKLISILFKLLYITISSFVCSAQVFHYSSYLTYHFSLWSFSTVKASANTLIWSMSCFFWISMVLSKAYSSIPNQSFRRSISPFFFVILSSSSLSRWSIFTLSLISALRSS